MKKGFTLIELLVVIAIIAILAAILFPVFAQAREKARASSCLSNCKQIGTAIQLYTDDYDETYPLLCMNNTTIAGGYLPGTNVIYRSQGIGSTLNYAWYQMIYSYVKNPDMFNCPSNAHKKFSGNGKVLGYGYNEFLSLAPSQVNTPAMKYGNTFQPAEMDAFVAHSMSEIKNPSQLVFCADTLAMANGANPFGYAYICPRCIIDSYNPITGGTPAKGDSPAARHNDGLNYTFCDGHAKYYKRTAGPCEDPTWATGGYKIGYAGQNSPWWNPAKQ